MPEVRTQDTEFRFERIRRGIGYIFGLLLFFSIMFLDVPEVFVDQAKERLGAGAVTPEALKLAEGTKVTLSLTILMVIFWLTEAIPIPATALLPAVVLPLFHVSGLDGNALHEFTPKHVLLNYAHPVIYLFLGGFLLAGAMRKWGLDRRLTLWVLTRGTLANSTWMILLAMMAVTAFLSMWISNTATAAMMLPLGLGVLSHANCEPGQSRFGTALMLGIAWAASVGGVGTIIGSPPNGIALSILDSSFRGADWYREIRFLDWMKFGVPYVVLFIPVVWSVLLIVFPPELKSIPGGKARLMDESKALGFWSRGEKMVLGVFLLIVVLWISSPFWETLLGPSVAHGLEWFDEYTIALFGAMLLFLTPVNWKDRLFVLDWKDSKYVDWGTLLLFGGGIALSDAMFRTGLASWVASSFVGFIGHTSTLVLVLAIVLMVDFLTEITSNTAVASMMVPITITIAVGTGNDPVTLSVAAAVASSLAFMLPVATPPNALVYGTGYITVRQMFKGGLPLDMVGWIFTVVVLYLFGDLLFDIIHF